MGLIGCAAVWPLNARAQQSTKLPTIGFMGAGTQSGWSQWTAAFLQRLHELGWIEGRTVAIEYRWAEGRSERDAANAAEFVRLKVDVIVTVGGTIAKQATSDIPIVFAIGDPLGQSLVASLARPGGNITGLSLQSTDLVGKRLELLREVMPRLRRLAVLTNLGNASEVIEVQAVAKKLDLEVVVQEIKGVDDLVPAFEVLKGRAEALYVLANPLANANRVRINDLALGAQMPTVHGFRQYVETGGLMSYGPNTPDLFRRAGDYVDKILRGAKPAEMPVEQPTKFDLIVNLKTAKTLGLTIPPSLLTRADEVIE
jgi:putative ABC transport system substrate-binding protein